MSANDASVKTIKLAFVAPGQQGIQILNLQGRVAGYRIGEKDIPDCAAFFADNRTVIIPIVNLVQAELNFEPLKDKR